MYLTLYKQAFLRITQQYFIWGCRQVVICCRSLLRLFQTVQQVGCPRIMKIRIVSIFLLYPIIVVSLLYMFPCGVNTVILENIPDLPFSKYQVSLTIFHLAMTIPYMCQ